MQQPSESYFMTTIDRIGFTQNELNNIVFLCLKYTFGGVIEELKIPNNKDIKDIIFEINEDPTIDKILDRIIHFVAKRFGSERLGGNLAGYERHMRDIINNFVQQPYELRNDLGDDADAEELITKH